ncbi:MAG: DUF4870 domain-containing protein [Bacteroidales bacterium]
MNNYVPTERECEKSSYAYLMTLFIFFFGVPLPIINLLVVVFFYLMNRNETHFIRWHCMQCMLSQIPVFFINTVLFWWTVSILFFDAGFTYGYIIYLMLALLFNIIEMIIVIYAAIDVRKGNDIRWLAISDITDQLVKKEEMVCQS